MLAILAIQEQEAEELVSKAAHMFMTSKNSEQRMVAKAYATRLRLVLGYNQRYKAQARLDSLLQGRK